MDVNTHLAINSALVGRVTAREEGAAQCVLEATQTMAADARGLVHGGFIFGLADYAAMVAINDPNVVLGKSEVKFLAPSKVGDTLEANAKIISQSGKKHQVEVDVSCNGRLIFQGTFTCFVLKTHVLDAR